MVAMNIAFASFVDAECKRTRQEVPAPVLHLIEGFDDALSQVAATLAEADTTVNEARRRAAEMRDTAHQTKASFQVGHWVIDWVTRESHSHRESQINK